MSKRWLPLKRSSNYIIITECSILISNAILAGHTSIVVTWYLIVSHYLDQPKGRPGGNLLMNHDWNQSNHWLPGTQNQDLNGWYILQTILECDIICSFESVLLRIGTRLQRELTLLAAWFVDCLHLHPTYTMTIMPTTSSLNLTFFL